MQFLPPPRLTAALLPLLALGCFDGTQTGVPEPFEASVEGTWRLDYEPAQVFLTEGGFEDAEGVVGAGPIRWKGESVSLRCSDRTLLCPEEVLGGDDGRWVVEELDPSELSFEVTVQPTACTPEERAASRGGACGSELLPVERRIIDLRLPSDGSTFFMPRSEMGDGRRACYARTSVEVAFHDAGEPAPGSDRPHARAVEGLVTVRIDAACLEDDAGRPLAKIGTDAELVLESGFTGSWSPTAE